MKRQNERIDCPYCGKITGSIHQHLRRVHTFQEHLQYLQDKVSATYRVKP